MKERAGTVPDESGSRLTSAELDAGGPGAVPADEYAYQYEDIGNRLSSLDLGTSRTYTANFLNQY
ncbi:MAG: hypothetical protein IKL96_04950, partial [Kiritimatiellae bacterium]|nr:hypothetical protein [Kiritimatiellia bacterium]